MKTMTIMLAGYSHPYPFRKEFGLVEKTTDTGNKVKAARNGRRKLAWLKNTFYSPTETEFYPFEHSNKAAHDIRNLESNTVPGSDRRYKVPDEIICGMLQKIWFDLHPAMDRWDKMGYKPSLDAIIEMTSANQPPLILPAAKRETVTLQGKAYRTGQCRKLTSAFSKIFRRLFGKQKT